MEVLECNVDITIEKSTLVTSEMHGFEVNIIFIPVESMYWKLEVIGNIQENDKKN